MQGPMCSDTADISAPCDLRGSLRPLSSLTIMASVGSHDDDSDGVQSSRHKVVGGVVGLVSQEGTTSAAELDGTWTKVARPGVERCFT